MNTKWKVPYGDSDAIFLFAYFIFKYATGGMWISGLYEESRMYSGNESEHHFWKVVMSPAVRFNLKTAMRVHFLLCPSLSEIISS